MSYPIGTRVRVAYTGYHIFGVVVPYDEGELILVKRSWTNVRQDYGCDSSGRVQAHQDYTDVPEDERPVFLAANEFITLPGEPPAPSPLAALARGMGYDV
jgi:hypothetical protein